MNIDNKLDATGGGIFALLGLVGLYATTFGRSESVTLLFTIIGIFAFLSLLGYGVNKLLKAKVN